MKHKFKTFYAIIIIILFIIYCFIKCNILLNK